MKAKSWNDNSIIWTSNCRLTSTSNEIIIKQVVCEIKKAVIEVKLAKFQLERNRKYIPYKDTGTGSCTRDYRWMLRNAGELGTRTKMAARWLPNAKDFFEGFLGLLQTSENNFHSATYDNSEFLFRWLDQLKKELCQRCWIGLSKRIMEFLKYMILPATYVPY